MRNSEPAQDMLRTALVASETDVSTSSYEGFHFAYILFCVGDMDAKFGISTGDVENRVSYIGNRRKHVEV